MLTLVSKIQELQEKCSESNLPTPNGDEQFKQNLMELIVNL